MESCVKSVAPKVDDAVAEVWQRIFGVPASRGDRLLDILTHSPGAVRSEQLGRLISGIDAAVGVYLPLSVSFESPTAAELAQMIRSHTVPDYVRPLRIIAGVGKPLFVLPGLGGIGLDALALVRRLTFAGPVYFNPPRGIDGTEPDHSLEAVVADHISVIKTIQPNGPYFLLGYSWGGLVAIEMARRLRASGETIGFLGAIDPILPIADWTYGAWIDFLTHRIRHHLKLLWRMRSPAAAFRHTAKGVVSTADKILRLFGVTQLWPLAAPAEKLPVALRTVWEAESEIIKTFRLQHYDSEVTIFATQSGHAAACSPEKIWPAKVERLNLQWVPGNHQLIEPEVEQLANAISAFIAAHRAKSALGM